MSTKGKRSACASEESALPKTQQKFLFNLRPRRGCSLLAAQRAATATGKPLLSFARLRKNKPEKPKG